MILLAIAPLMIWIIAASLWLSWRPYESELDRRKRADFGWHENEWKRK